LKVLQIGSVGLDTSTFHIIKNNFAVKHKIISTAVCEIRRFHDPIFHTCVIISTNSAGSAGDMFDKKYAWEESLSFQIHTVKFA
jgi:hypothetical protein